MGRDRRELPTIADRFAARGKFRAATSFLATPYILGENLTRRRRHESLRTIQTAGAGKPAVDTEGTVFL